MADGRISHRAAGFSLVEMMVALVFVMVLMAGMASVFKASLSNFYTAGESVSSARRGRMSIDLFGVDLDTACMYLTNLTNPPPVDQNHPPFQILPNMPILNDPNNLKADIVFFQVDQPLAFEGLLQAGGGANNAASVLNNGGVISANNADNTFLIECGNTSYANQVTVGQTAVFKDTFATGTIINVTPLGTQVRVVLGVDPLAAVTGLGSTGLPMNAGHITNGLVHVVFVQQGQIIRYMLQYLSLDPNNTIPCLVRDQGSYDGAGIFQPVANLQQIITENVSNFKVYLSVDGGKDWAGWADPPVSYVWTDLVTLLTNQLGNVATNQFTTLDPTSNWFRSIPTAVRLDITTRSATQRTEYYVPTLAQPVGTAYKTQTQSLIFMPKHSGLPMN